MSDRTNEHVSSAMFAQNTTALSFSCLTAVQEKRMKFAHNFVFTLFALQLTFFRKCVAGPLPGFFGGGAYLNNRDQIINVGMICYSSSEDLQPME